MSPQPVLERALTIVSAVLVPVAALLIHHHVITSQDGIDLGGIWAAAVGSFHAGTAVQRSRRPKAAATLLTARQWAESCAQVLTGPAHTVAAAEEPPPAPPLTPTPEQLPPAGA